MSPFAEPDELPKWLADWFVETIFVESASTLRLLNRAWAQFVAINTARLSLRLNRASKGDEASLVGKCRRLAQFPLLAEVDCGPSPTDNAGVAAAALGALARHLPKLKALDASQWTLLPAEALSCLHQVCAAVCCHGRAGQSLPLSSAASPAATRTCRQAPHSLNVLGPHPQGCGQLRSLTLRLERVSLGAAAAALAPLSALASLDIRAAPEEEGQLRLLPASLTSLSLGQCCPWWGPAPHASHRHTRMHACMHVCLPACMPKACACTKASRETAAPCRLLPPGQPRQDSGPRGLGRRVRRVPAAGLVAAGRDWRRGRRGASERAAAKRRRLFGCRAAAKAGGAGH